MFASQTSQVVEDSGVEMPGVVGKAVGDGVVVDCSVVGRIVVAPLPIVEMMQVCL